MTADATPTISPQVVDKLIDMSDYLRSLSKFQVDTEVSRDTVLETSVDRPGINRSIRAVM
ncbi:hypothetical protein ACYZTM_29025 [Pseudomonas sp. MDT2-39-1]